MWPGISASRKAGPWCLGIDGTRQRARQIETQRERERDRERARARARGRASSFYIIISFVLDNGGGGFSGLGFVSFRRFISKASVFWSVCQGAGRVLVLRGKRAFGSCLQGISQAAQSMNRPLPSVLD